MSCQNTTPPERLIFSGAPSDSPRRSRVARFSPNPVAPYAPNDPESLVSPPSCVMMQYGK